MDTRFVFRSTVWSLPVLPISIIGESRKHCIVMGGLKMNGTEEDDVNVTNLTLRDSKCFGVFGDGVSIHLDNVSVENSQHVL